VQDTLGTNFSMFTRCLVQIIVSLIIMLFISPILTGVTFGGIIPLVLFTSFYQRWMRDLQRRIQT